MKKIKKVMLVEDSPSDADIMKEILEKEVDVFVCEDGQEALNHFDIKNSETPDLIILDLNMPKVHGFDVLDYVKTKKELKHIPVIVFTSSNSWVDIKKTYDLNGSAYLTKPLDFEEFISCINSIKGFWIDWVVPIQE